MTAQISDCYKYKGKKYDLVAISESIGFKPSNYGLHPQGIMTSCWRGYWCDYEIKNKALKLKVLHRISMEFRLRLLSFINRRCLNELMVSL